MDFYEKHKKAILLFAGLAILALVVTIVLNGEQVYITN